MFKTQYSSPRDFESNGRHLIEYNLIRQKLFLKYLKDLGIISEIKDEYLKKFKYNGIVEETEIPALSLGRVAIEEGLGKPWYIVSPSYTPDNIFGLKGANGHLFVNRNGTQVLGFVTEDPFDKEYSLNNSPHKHLDYFYELPKKLIIVQGQPERAFNLVNSEIDTVFGDVFDQNDWEKRMFYEELYNYMHDYYKLNTKFELGKDVVIKDKEKVEDGKRLKLIYCKKENHLPASRDTRWKNR